ncbi:hypothetical protein CDL12_29354 [Handroanthus impetiginosus]|uniref:Uncharacterized protein n=1 Tax=Handroanthus impetiginosus TaxID=429701 RepID=A0A2G9FYN4_9LAMI|nr:hypothetical protein CDL12_29354 [Handroanthus impetiginosus]
MIRNCSREVLNPSVRQPITQRPNPDDFLLKLAQQLKKVAQWLSIISSPAVQQPNGLKNPAVQQPNGLSSWPRCSRPSQFIITIHQIIISGPRMRNPCITAAHFKSSNQ